MLALPVYVLSRRRVVGSKVGELCAPEVTRLDGDDVFGGESLCISDYIMEAFGGSCDDLGYMVIVVKKGARSTPDGWFCDYDKKAKSTLLNDIRSKDEANDSKHAAMGKPYDDGMFTAEIKKTMPIFLLISKKTNSTT